MPDRRRHFAGGASRNFQLPSSRTFEALFQSTGDAMDHLVIDHRGPEFAALTRESQLPRSRSTSGQGH